MRASLLISGLLGTTVLFVGNTHAQTSFTHTVSIAIEPVSVIAVSGDPLPMLVDRASVDGRSSVADASTFYNLTTNVANVVIEVELDFEMPEDTELWLAGDTRLGRSTGRIKLDGSGQPRRLISSIAQGIENGRSLAFEFVARANVEELPLQSRRVTLALIDAQHGKRQQVFQTVVFGVYPSDAADPVYLTQAN